MKYDSRRRRIGFRIAMSLWLFSIAGTGVFWLRGYRVSDIARWTSTRGRMFGVQSSRGQIMIGSVWIKPAQAKTWSPMWSPGWSCESISPTDLNEPFPMASGIDLRFAGFRLIATTNASMIAMRVVVLPMWFVILLEMFPLPIILWRRHRSRALVRLRMCLQCGYDLRASSDRCPECGTPIPTGNAAISLR